MDTPPTTSGRWRPGSLRVPLARPGPLHATQQERIAAAAAIAFVTLALVISFVPIPFAVWAPGDAWDLLSSVKAKNGTSAAVIHVDGVPTYPTTGELYLLTISESRASSNVALPQALLAHWLPDRDALPQDLLYPPGKSADQVAQEDAVQMNTSQHDAVVAALRAGGQKITQMPVVDAVITTGPAAKKLVPGDFVIKVDGVPVDTPAKVYAQIATHKVAADDLVVFEINRDGQPAIVQVGVVGSNTDPLVPVVGARFSMGYSHAARVRYNIDENIGGPSGGLMFALGLYDVVTPGDLLKGRVVAGTGSIAADGTIGQIGGIQEKIGAAEAHGAQIFFVPAGNCPDLARMPKTKARLVKVATLKDAIRDLTLLTDPATAGKVPTCG